MTEGNLKTRVMLIFGTMLAMAMLLQSTVVIVLGVRASIDEDVTRSKTIMQAIAESAHPVAEKIGKQRYPAENYDTMMAGYRHAFSCMFIEVEGEVQWESSRCSFREELLRRSSQAKRARTAATGFAGGQWRTTLFGSDAALISVPLINHNGQVYGSINAERSLLPIYSRYRKAAGIAFCYLLVNLILFSSLGFFRFVGIFFKPLTKLLSITEDYRPDEQSLLSFSEEESAFRKLSMSLNGMLARIKRDNQRLLQTVSELEDSNRKLKEKNDLVIRSEKLASVGRLSAGLAHEIGNPLTIVQGYVELLGREDLSADEKRKFSSNAQQELDRIKSLIRQLLDFSRPPLQPTKEIVAANALISEVISFVSVEKFFARCQIRTELNAEKDSLLIEKDALRQVIVNVLFNAVDAVAEKNEEREICIASYNESSGGETFLGISVQDNGNGIAGENLKQVFDPFYTTKEVGRGTGLGLFVCHTIVERTGGHIDISNRNPAGVDVRIILPIIEGSGQRT